MARRWIDVDDKTDDGGTDNEDLRNNGGGVKADGEDFKEMTSPSWSRGSSLTAASQLSSYQPLVCWSPTTRGRKSWCWKWRNQQERQNPLRWRSKWLFEIIKERHQKSPLNKGVVITRKGQKRLYSDAHKSKKHSKQNENNYSRIWFILILFHSVFTMWKTKH